MAAVAAVVAAVISAVVALNATQAEREEAALERRNLAYSSYVSEQMSFHEFMWETYAWSSANASEPTSFRADSRVARAELEASYWQARLATRDPQALQTLIDLHGRSDQVWEDVKCLTDVSSKGKCVGLAPDASQVPGLLDDLSAARTEAFEALSGQAH